MDTENIMYHYTSQNGFEGIVREDGLHFWFSDTRYMNDSYELIDAKRFLMRAADDLLKEKKIDEEIYKYIGGINYPLKKFAGIKTVPTSGTAIRFNISSAYYRKFVCCFSKEADSLPMWNYYLKGDQNGYAVGIDLDGVNTSDCEIIGEVKDESDFEIDQEIISILYDEEEKISIFKSEILDFSRDMNENADNAIKKLECITRFQQAFEVYSCRFKDYHFAYEQEQRLSATVKESNRIYIDEKRRDDIKFRLSHGLAIPYFELYIPKKEVLKAISISPKIGLNTDDKAAIDSMRSYLLHLGYNHKIDIRCSEIPLRYY